MKERKFCSSRLMGWVRSLNFWPNFKALCLLRFVCLGDKRKKNLFFLVDGFGLLLIRILNFYTIWVHEFVSSINFTLVSALKYVILW